MPLQQQEILKICEILAEQEDLRVTINESFKGACYAFAGALMGGVLGGPVGLGIGGAAGSVIAACKSKEKFKSAVHVIMYDMPEREKQKLATAVQNVIQNIDASDVVTLIAILNGNNITRTIVIDLIKSALTNDLGLRLAPQ